VKVSAHNVQEVPSEQKLQLAAQLLQFGLTPYFPAPQPVAVQVLEEESHISSPEQTEQSEELLQEVHWSAQARHEVPDRYFPAAQPQVLSACKVKPVTQTEQVLASEQVVQPALQALHVLDLESTKVPLGQLHLLLLAANV